MTPLRAKYIRDLVIRGRSKHTQEAYIRYVCDLARYYRRSPELISYEEVTGWLYHLIKERQLSASSDHPPTASPSVFRPDAGLKMLCIMFYTAGRSARLRTRSCRVDIWCDEVVSARPVATVRRNECVAAVLYRYLRSVLHTASETWHPSQEVRTGPRFPARSRDCTG